MIKFDILNRWSGAVQFSAEIDCDDGAPQSVKLSLAIKVALRARANLAGANLAGAYLAGANLALANLAGAYLAGAYLAGANLAGANLAGANLAGAYLAGANLAGAYLAGANLALANLAGANLAGAYLAGAYLAGAYLAGAKWRDGITINRQPLHIGGLLWPVWILDQHMQIGCELHRLDEWAAFDDSRILQMDGKEALTFWRAHKAALLALALSDGRGVTQPEAVTA
jgi:uncharacterized protein YjbI with pentapeptide repeats